MRDLDILKKLAGERLLRVSISLTTLDEEVRRMLEPRTASVLQRLKTIEVLAAAGISVNVMLAPIIPGINDHEIMAMAKKVSELGAQSIAHTLVRLNGDVGIIFEDWIQRTMPGRAEKVLNKIRACHGGNLNDSRFGTRMSGEGKIAEIVHQRMRLAKRMFFGQTEKWDYNYDLHSKFKSSQMQFDF